MSDDTSSASEAGPGFATAPVDPEPSTDTDRQLCVRIPIALRRQLRMRAARTDTTIQKLVTTYIERGLAQRRA